MVEPLTEMTKKGVGFVWNEKAEQAFQEIKDRFTREPILYNYHDDRESIIETDASDTCVAGVHLQRDDNGKLHPVAYYSSKMDKTEQNYNIYEKELMAIVKSLKHWRIYLQGAKFPVIIHTDHMNLRTFTTTKVLDNRRLARWAEELASFDLIIKHVKGKDNARADALSRPPGYEDDKTYQETAILKALPNGDLVPNLTEIAVLENKPTEVWRNKLIRAQQNKEGVKWPEPPVTVDGLIRVVGKIWLPSSIAPEFIEEQHALPAHGHQGVRRTYLRIKRQYWSPGLRTMVNKVVTECDTCIRNKASHHAPYGQMHTTEIPPSPWKSISWDFIGPLPKSKDPTTGVEYDYLLVIIDRLTKYMILVPCKTTLTAETLAAIFLKEVIAVHGLPEEILSDRDKLFTSKFWSALVALLGVKRKMSTAFHPQTNGGNERVNQVVEAYLRCYVNYQQNNWVGLLPLAQFAYNSSASETTQVTPNYANFGYELVAYREPGIPEVENQSAMVQTERLKEVHKELAAELKFVAERNAHYYNKKRSQEPTLKEGDKVYLLRKNIETKRPSAKLDHKKLGPFKIKKVKGPLNYELALPKNMNIHPVFHISLLELAPPGAPKAPETEIISTDQNAEYEVENILDCKYIRGKVKYLVKWEDYPDSENTWELEKDLKHLEKFEEFRRQNPNLPRKKGGSTRPARKENSSHSVKKGRKSRNQS
ncbi:hypothetical protein SS1G_00932 [Sclerotinia sclerotiorum 1980 UF-70]|nr:hypothetical protein SS1G_00932 [Sclerotinia sclerotiorum 1980 UF-70]EDN91529.1 hypothetical protein SS1G_00932 [Sclerotinia sclerotiorum 1980 UF-70]